MQDATANRFRLQGVRQDMGGDKPYYLANRLRSIAEFQPLSTVRLDGNYIMYFHGHIIWTLEKLPMLEPCDHLDLYGHRKFDQITGWLNFDTDVRKSQETHGFNIHVVEETDGHFTQTLGSTYVRPDPRSQAFNGPFPTRARAPTSGTTTCPRASNRCHLLHLPSLARSLHFRSRIHSQLSSCCPFHSYSRFPSNSKQR